VNRQPFDQQHIAANNLLWARVPGEDHPMQPQLPFQRVLHRCTSRQGNAPRLCRISVMASKGRQRRRSICNAYRSYADRPGRLADIAEALKKEPASVMALMMRA
jgi:hypothetical protein